mmetsp:Transcript_38513/g.67959  ORF Transcript_38513/g.67959 Transcript_38513/m.67959 type:complete len:434 (+) Transcript_38513:26-1327(+)
MKTMFSCLCFSMGNLLPFFVIGEPACHIEHLERHEIAERSSCWKLPQCPQMPNDHCGHKQASLLHDGSQFDLGSFWASGYSQVGQDGVLWALFNVLGAGGKYYVEFGVQAGCERNTRWLAERCGWSGLLLDGGFQNSSIGLHQAFISAANIVALLQKYQVPKNIDLLSIDIDGQDWHVWHALGEAGYRPRVLVIEYGSQFAYPGDLVRPRKDDSPGNGFGNHVLCMQRAKQIQVFSESSSAEAFQRLGCFFGYTAIYIQLPDMYFVRDDVLAPHRTRFANLEKGVHWMERRYNPHPPLNVACTLLLQGHGMLPAALLLGKISQSKECTSTLPASTNARRPTTSSTELIMRNPCFEKPVKQPHRGFEILASAMLALAFCALGYTAGRKDCQICVKLESGYSEVSGIDANDQRPHVVGAENDLPTKCCDFEPISQ